MQTHISFWALALQSCSTLELGWSTLNNHHSLSANMLRASWHAHTHCMFMYKCIYQCSSILACQYRFHFYLAMYKLHAVIIHRGFTSHQKLWTCTNVPLANEYPIQYFVMPLHSVVDYLSVMYTIHVCSCTVCTHTVYMCVLEPCYSEMYPWHFDEPVLTCYTSTPWPVCWYHA